MEFVGARLNFEPHIFPTIKQKQQEAETLMKLHEQLLRELIAIPGTFTRLQPVKGMAV